MKSVKSAEEFAREAAEQALISAIRQRRYWLEKGEPNEKAIKKAAKQAVGMLDSSGSSADKLYKLFDELGENVETFKKKIKEVEKEREEEKKEKEEKKKEK